MEQHQEDQLKIDYCITEMCYASFMETTKQTPMADIRKIKKKRNLSIPLKKVIKLQRKRSREKERNY